MPVYAYQVLLTVKFYIKFVRIIQLQSYIQLRNIAQFCHHMCLLDFSYYMVMDC